MSGFESNKAQGDRVPVNRSMFERWVRSFAWRVTEGTRQMDEEQLKAAVRRAAGDAVRACGRSKWETLKQTWRFWGRAFRFSMKELAVLIRQRGDYWGNVRSRFQRNATGQTTRWVNYGKQFGKKFMALPPAQKKEVAASAAVVAATVLIVGGGIDFEGGVPDLDIRLLGIGRHRSILTHSVLTPFLLEFGIRFLSELQPLLEDPPHQPTLTGRLVAGAGGVVKQFKTELICGLWLGYAVHLFKDAALFSGDVKPYPDLPFSANSEAHQGIFSGNSFFSFIAGVQDESV